MLKSKSQTKLISIRIYLIRHAESEYNKLGIVQGHLDAQLSENGIQQSLCVARFLKNIKFDYCYTSDLIRASKNFGDAQGQKKCFMSQKAAELNIKFEDFIPNGAETILDVQKRWKMFLKNLFDFLSSKEQNKDEIEIMIMSHGAFIREAIKYMLREYKNEFKFDLNELKKSGLNTSITKFIVYLEINSLNEWNINFVKFESLYDKNHLEKISETFCDL